MTNDELTRATPADPWIGVAPAPRAEPPAGPYGPPPVVRSPGRTAGKVVALFAGGAVAGALVVRAWTGFGTRDATRAAAAQPGVPGVGPGGSGGPGGANGEQRIQGTLTAVAGSSVTVRTASGSATYTITPQTQIVRDGGLVGAADLTVGDTVLAHVFPAQGSDGVLERLLVTAASSSGGAGATSTSGSDDVTGDDATTA